MTYRSRSAVALALLATVALPACGGHDSHSSGNTDATSLSIVADATFNDADVAFTQDMIPHHEQAIEMAGIALDPKAAAGPEVTDLATRIQGAQDPEIATMKGWLTAWGQPEMGDLPDHDMSSMDGMMSADDMDKLGTLTGADFDTAWLEMMIAHHEGAVKMSDDVKANGKSPDVATLADQIIAGQTAEIAEMKGLLGS
jgi:uncharacterized protein (DUF305 family)